MATVVGPPILDRSLQQALLGFAQPIGQALAGQQGQKGQRGTFREIQDPETGETVTALINPVTGQIISTFPSVPGGADPFTLSPGQQRFGAGGQIIAGVPEAPDPFTLGPGQQRYGPGGGLLAQAPFGPYTLGPGEQRFGIGGQPLGPAMPDPFTLGPGQQRFGAGGQPIGAQVPFRPPPPVRGVRQIVEVSPGEYRAQLVDPTTGQTIRDFGTPSPREMVGEVAPEALSKPVKVQMEKEIGKINKSILESETVMSLWKPEFSTLGAQLEAWWTRGRERIKGIPFAGKAIEAIAPVTPKEKRALANYSRWRGAAGKKFFAFRKWVTGVAGGQLEMDQIRQVFPDEKTKSPTEFSAMYDQMITFEKAYRRQLVEAIRRGTVITDKVKADIMVDVFSTQSQLQQTGLQVPVGGVIPGANVPSVSEPNSVDAIGNKFGF